MLLESCMPKEENLKFQVEVCTLETNKQANKTVKDKKTLRGRPKMKDSYEDKYLSSQKRWQGLNIGERRLVRHSGTASRDTSLLVFCLHMRSYP